MSQQIRGHGGHLGFSISPKNTNMVENVQILLSDKFRRILFCGFREEVENISANQRPGRPSWISDRPVKNKLGMKSCFILIFVEFRLAITKKKSKMFPIRVQGGHFGFPIGLKKHKPDREFR